MKANNPNSNSKAVNNELVQLSPKLATLGKPTVPMPNDDYFANLADKAMLNAIAAHKPKLRFKLIPWSLASIAAAASIVLALIFWPTDISNTYDGLAFDSLSNDELMQLAMQDEDMLDEQLIEDDSLVATLAAVNDFKYLEPPGENDEYNRLLWEMVDDETLMEDWL